MYCSIVCLSLAGTDGTVGIDVTGTDFCYWPEGKTNVASDPFCCRYLVFAYIQLSCKGAGIYIILLQTIYTQFASASKLCVYSL